MTKSEVMRLLARLEVAYDEGHDLEREARWIAALADEDADGIEGAADAYMRREPKWFPKPAQLIATQPLHIPVQNPEPRERRPIQNGHVLQVGTGAYWLWPKTVPVPPEIIDDALAFQRKRGDINT